MTKYWAKRFERLEAVRHYRANKSMCQIARAFSKAQATIDKEIEAWIARIAVNNEVTIEEARRLLTAKELEEFRWDVWEYIKRGKEYDLNGKWMKELENASAKVHISRLEALRIRLQQAAEEAFQIEHNILSDELLNGFLEDYKHTAFELQKGAGVGFQIGGVNRNYLENLMSRPWTADGFTFSDRIWQQKSKFLDTLQRELLQSCMLGKNPSEVANKMIPFVDKDVKNAQAAANRLVMTESAYFGTQAQAKCFKDLDVEEYEFVATLDYKTSEICRDMDGRHFKLTEKKEGVNAPPMHPHCRSCIAPYFDDEEGRGGERIARAATGKTYYVPKDMTYREWEKKYAEDAGRPDDIKQYERLKNILGDDAPESLSDYLEAKRNKTKEYAEYKKLLRERKEQ